MAEKLLNRILNDEIDQETFFEWLFTLNRENKKSPDFSTQWRCSRIEFITFFLNFIHEEVGSSCNEKNVDTGEGAAVKRLFVEKNSSEINKSRSFPSDLSLELNDSGSNNASTPNITKVNSEWSVMSPISPIYRSNNSFSTPKNHKTSICLGDFITDKRLSSKKKTKISNSVSESKRRIKPTNLAQQKVNSFHKTENSFNFNNSAPDELPSERNVLAEERLKVLSRSDFPCITSPKRFIYSYSENSEIIPDFQLVTHKQQLDLIVKIYTDLANHNFILNLTSEMYFLVSLLLKKQFYSIDWGIDVLSDEITASNLFQSIHNITYFASRCLLHHIRILKNYDKSTTKLLMENDRIIRFVPDLIDKLKKLPKSDRFMKTEVPQDNVCFNSDTDNRQNFPNDPSFHAFRKQRDLFYEILRIWEQQHLSPGFSFAISLGGKVKSLLHFSTEPTNYVHFARLFKAQLLRTCLNGDCENFFPSLEIDAQKLSKLRNRCITKGSSQGGHSLPQFNESEEFYKDFILVAANYCFNRHLTNAFIEEIVELNETNFSCSEFDKDSDVDYATKKSYYSCVKALRLLAKFLGFVESLPYKTDSSYPEQLLLTHLKVRQQICPNFNIKTLLQKAIRCQTVILCIPWLVKYLSMLDYVTLTLPYYTEIHNNLFWLYRYFNWAPDFNIYLVRFCLGWFFELPHIPDKNYLQFWAETQISPGQKVDISEGMTLDQLEIADQNILYLCCPYLGEIKKLLSSTATDQTVPVKHITPVTALQSPEEVARKKLELQLEEAFFNGQPISLRKTVEFVSERVASTCVKFICNTLVPNHKKNALEKFRASITFNETEDVNNQKISLKTKASEMATLCLRDLQNACDSETETLASQKVSTAIDSLASLDILPQTKKVCIEITKKYCLERIKQWTNSHVTLGIFSKDFNDEIQKLFNSGDNRRPKKPIFVLPPAGTKSNHNDNTTSAAHLLEKFTHLSIQVVERKVKDASIFTELLDETIKSFNERGDVNQCILATICTQLLDLSLLLVAHNSKMMTEESILVKSCEIWKLYYNGGNDLFKSLLCPRNVAIFAQSCDVAAAWNAFAVFCAYIIKNEMLTCDNFESQCIGIFKTDWDQSTLKLITDFLKTFVQLYNGQGGRSSQFAFLLNFLSDYCEDLF